MFISSLPPLNGLSILFIMYVAKVGGNIFLEHFFNCGDFTSLYRRTIFS